MSGIGNRVSRLEARRKPNGGVIVVEYWDSADDPKVAQAEHQAREQGGQVIIIQKFCPRRPEVLR